MSDWTPAIIATHEHVLKFHKNEPRQVTKFAGTKIRVQESDEARRQMDVLRKSQLGCPGYSVRVHPDDAARLWPTFVENGENLTLCTCVLLMD
jgi:hypothetical protein